MITFKTCDTMDTYLDELVLTKIDMYMRVVKFKRISEKKFYNDTTAVRAYENLKKQLPVVLRYLSKKEMNIVLDRYKDDLEYLKNNP